MLERFREHLWSSGLIGPGQTVLVGYSGGADSTCLLHLLHLLGADVIAAHLHHGQRPEAEEEMRRCEEFCNTLGVPFVGGRADVPTIAREMKIGLEEAGRNARYAFFRQAAAALGCHRIATAHTRDDHVETVLFNIARGSGLDGLTGIRSEREGIIRPLLPFTRAETVAHCREHGLWTHDDPANTDLQFSRARLRHRVLPELRTINPGFDEAVTRLANVAGEETAFLDSMAAAALEQSEIRLNGELHFLTQDVEAAFDRHALLHLPPVLLRRAARLAARAVGGELSYDSSLALDSGLRTQEKGSVTAEGGVVVLEWQADRLHVRHTQAATPFRHSLTVPGETISDEFGWTLQAMLLEGPGHEVKRASLQAPLDRRKLKGELYFRSYKDGDRIQPLGFSSERKLSDLLGEAKLTGAARRRLPIICDMLGPVWAPGVCLAERARADGETAQMVILRFAAHAETRS